MVVGSKEEKAACVRWGDFWCSQWAFATLRVSRQCQSHFDLGLLSHSDAEVTLKTGPETLVRLEGPRKGTPWLPTFKPSLVFIVSSKPAGATGRPCHNNNEDSASFQCSCKHP